MPAHALRLRPGNDTARLRRRLGDAIERLIAALDALTDDPDLEDGNDAEAVNEDGGDVQDEPHDADEGH